MKLLIGMNEGVPLKLSRLRILHQGLVLHEGVLGALGGEGPVGPADAHCTECTYMGVLDMMSHGTTGIATSHNVSSVPRGIGPVK